MNTTNCRELNYAAYHECMAGLINYMLIDYKHFHTLEELASSANITVKTLRKIRRGDVSVEDKLCLKVYIILAEFKHYTNYRISCDLALLNQALLEGRKEY